MLSRSFVVFFGLMPAFFQPGAAEAAETGGYATVTLYQNLGGVGGATPTNGGADAPSSSDTSVDFYYDPNSPATSYTIVAQPEKGRAVDNDDGTFTFFLDSAFNNLGSGVSETVTLWFRETGTFTMKSIDITIQGATASVTPPATPANETTGDSNGDGAITTNTGDAIETPVLNIFRPLASPVPAVTPQAQDSSGDADTATTASSPASTTGEGGAPSNIAQRFASRGGESARPLLGQASAVAVSGAPNQTFAISLPGKTSYSAGQVSISIETFLHDAGATPTVTGNGRAVFNVGAQFSGTQTAEDITSVGPAGDSGQNIQPGTAVTEASLIGGAGAVGDDLVLEAISVETSGGSVADLAEPVVTSSPFVNITISYN